MVVLFVRKTNVTSAHETSKSIPLYDHVALTENLIRVLKLSHQLSVLTVQDAKK